MANYELRGIAWTLNLGSQDFSNAFIEGASIAASTGTASSGAPIFSLCVFDANVTIPPSVLRKCFMGDATTTFGSAGNFYLNSCKSRVPGSGSPMIDFGAAVGATNVSIRDYSGGYTFTNIASGDVMSIGGPDIGTVTLGGADGTVDVRGTGKPVVDNRTGSPTLTLTGYITDIANNILTDTAEIGAAGAGLTDLGGMSTSMKGEVNAEADTAISDASLSTAAALATVDANVDAILLDTGTDGVVLSTSTIQSIADGILDRSDGVEPASSGTERTVRESLRIILSATAGKVSGAATTTMLFRDSNDSKNRITATVDADGNRSAITLDDT